MTERQHPDAEVADRLGFSGHSLYAWIKRYNTPEAEIQRMFPLHQDVFQPKRQHAFSNELSPVVVFRAAQKCLLKPGQFTLHP